MIWNILEQFPGTEMVRAADEVQGTDTGYQIRVPHSSGMLEGKYTLETTFEATDHRSHRPHSWLVNGVKKIETLRFLETPQRTLGQAAIQWLLAEPRVTTVLPNIYDAEQLREFATATEAPELTASELAQNRRAHPDELRRRGRAHEIQRDDDPRSRGGGDLKSSDSHSPDAPAPIGPYRQAAQLLIG